MSAAPMPPIPGFRLGHPQTTPGLAFGPPAADVALTERHRPRTLDAMVGQGAAVWQLRQFAEAPASKAFLFEGPTGVGKTTAALALAEELGVSADWGLHVIKSARADGEAVDDAMRLLRHACPAGSGWKLVVVDEADLMTPKAAHLWLSALEDLPPRSVVVFTTNAPERFPDRFLDRCERVAFASDGAALGQDAQSLVDRIWRAETGGDDAPRVEGLNVMDRDGKISFRRAVAALDPLVRAAISGRQARPVQPMAATAPAAPDPEPEPAIIPMPVKPSRAKRPAAAAPEGDAVAKLRRQLQHIEDEYTELGRRLWQLDDDKAAIERRIREHERAAKRAK